MTGLRITYRRIVICFVEEPNPSRRRVLILIRFPPLAAAPCDQEAFKIGKAAGVSAVLYVMKQMPPAAVAIFPTLGEKGFEVSRRCRLWRAPTSIGWGFERQPFRDAAAAISRATQNVRAGQAFFAQSVDRIEHSLPGLPMRAAKLIAPCRFRELFM